MAIVLDLKFKERLQRSHNAFVSQSVLIYALATHSVLITLSFSTAVERLSPTSFLYTLIYARARFSVLIYALASDSVLITLCAPKRSCLRSGLTQHSHSAVRLTQRS